MFIKDLIQLIVTSALSTNKIRTGLTILALSIGVILIVGGSTVLESYIEWNSRNMSELGTTQFWVISNSNAVMIDANIISYTSNINLNDIEAIRKQSTLLKEIVPIANVPMAVKYKDAETVFTVRGTAPEHIPARDSKIIAGSFFSPSDMAMRARVCVIEQNEGSIKYFGGNPIGENVSIGGFNFKIVGQINTPAEGVRQGGKHNLIIYLPLTTMQEVFGTRDINVTLANAINSANLNKAEEQVANVLLQRYGYPLKFRILDSAALIKTVDTGAALVQKILFTIAILSLLAGGIGVMNIMYVSILERTKEIGLLKALGAKNRYVLSQFVWEAIFICLIGGLGGVVLGLLLAFIIALILNMPFKIAIMPLLAGATLPIIIGVLSGYFPAKIAANLDPIEALKHE